MKIASTIARYLLGIIFLVFGLNGFLQFLPMTTPPGLAGQYFQVLAASHYLPVIFICQLIPAILLLINRYVPLALTVLAAVIVNIVCFHVLMAPSGLPLALIVVLLWFLVFASVRSAFAGIFQQRAG